MEEACEAIFFIAQQTEEEERGSGGVGGGSRGSEEAKELYQHIISLLSGAKRVEGKRPDRGRDVASPPAHVLPRCT